MGAFEDDIAKAMLAQLAATYRIELPEAVNAYIVKRVGWPAPYYLQLIFHGLRDRPGRGVPLSESDVEQAIAALLDSAHRNYFDYWRQRLFEELGRPDGEYGKQILDAAAQDPHGTARATLSQVLSTSIADPAPRARTSCVMY